MKGKGNDFLPEVYGDNMVGLLSQGPGVLFVYWELSGIQWEVAAGLGGTVLLRLYKVNEGEGPDYDYILTREVAPLPHTNNWYFRHLEPGTLYSAEIGCRLPDGDIFTLVKSETVFTPLPPKHDFMPKAKTAGPEYGAVRPEPDFDANAGGTPERGFKLAEIIMSMPFYMGYDTELAD